MSIHQNTTFSLLLLMFWHLLLPSSERLSTRCQCIGIKQSDVWKLIGPFISVRRLVFFLPDVYRFPDPSIQSIAFFVNHLYHLSMLPVYDVVARNGVICDCRLVLPCCNGFAGASSVPLHITLCNFLSVVL